VLGYRKVVMKKAVGFTLVELSVVLVVIGIIMGMAIKGRDLIETSRLRKEIRKIDKFATAAALHYAETRLIPDNLYDIALAEGLLTDDDLEVNTYFNNSTVCQQHGCRWRFIKAIYDNESYRYPVADEDGDILLAAATQKNDNNILGYANSFVCKIEEYIDDDNFTGGQGKFLGTGQTDNYSGTCSPSKNLLNGTLISYGYKVF
jgi:prepilin-type N-terminal cleavage/methylation domain-containing protein